MNNTLYFSATEGINGRELWKSDGTANGTLLLKNISSGASSSNPAGLYNAGGILYFSAAGTGTERDLWKSDGTDAGTVRVKQFNAGAPADASPENFTHFNGYLYFTTAHSENAVFTGNELWQTDGTSGGTVLIDLYPGENDSYPSELTVLNNELLFTANDGQFGRELWKVSGAAAVSFHWTGNISTAWETPGNWSSNQVPISTSEVLIPAGRPRYPLVNASTSIKKLTVEPGASVILANSIALIISGSN